MIFSLVQYLHLNVLLVPLSHSGLRRRNTIVFHNLPCLASSFPGYNFVTPLIHNPYSRPEESRWWTRTTWSVSPRHESRNSARKQFCFTQCGFNKLWILFCLNFFFFLTVFSSVFNFLLSQVLKRLYNIKPTTFQSIFFNFIFIIIIITMIYSLRFNKYLHSNSGLCLVFLYVFLGGWGYVSYPFLSNLSQLCVLSSISPYLCIFSQHLHSP